MNGHREPISLRPWARDDAEATSLQDVLARVNLERGHFRDITEASLQEEIAAEGGLESSESDDSLSEDEGEKELKQTKANTREDLYRLKHEMLGFVGQAEQDVLKTLDFISLLESAHNTNGAVTVSQVLKQTVPLGSLGTDIWHRMPEDQTRQAQEKLIANSIRLQGLQKSADAILSAATRLEETARKEAKYWEEILGVSERGWSISRIRQRSHLLGVHFGFNGSPPSFARRDLAALVTDSDGDITLERGIGTRPMAMRVLIRKAGRIVGSSKLSLSPDASTASLDARIRHARDSLYDEELNHELLKECREMASMGVQLRDSEICFGMLSLLPTEDIQVSMELLSIDQVPNQDHEPISEKDDLAVSILLAARLLLSQSHRERLRAKASVPNPMSEGNESALKFPILKPLIWILRHMCVVDYLNQYLAIVVSILREASLNGKLTKLSISPPGLTTLSTVEALVTMLHRPIRSTATIELSRAHSDPLASGNIAAGGSPTDSYTLRLGAESLLQNATGCLFSGEIVNPSSSQRSEYYPVSELQSAFDDLIAELLIHILADALGTQQWRCDARALELRRLQRGADEQLASRIGISVNSAARTLMLENGLQQVVWQVGGAEKRSFTEAASMLATATG